MKRPGMRTLCMMAMTIGLAPAASAGLLGTTVTITAYCCLLPAQQDRFTVPASAIVSDALEFPAGSLTTLPPYDIITSNVDVTDSTIVLRYTTHAMAAQGSFNGFAFDFAGLGTQRIAAAELAPGSTFPVDSVRLFFDADTVFYSGAGLSFTPDSRVIINVALSPVPEPNNAAMIIAGLMLLGIGTRRSQPKPKVALN
jgi:hypothetical protein